MGCPVVLHDHEKYQHLRNEFRFNLCFVFEQDAETSSYEAIVRKLSRVFEGLELECNFLSQDVNSELQTVQNVIEQLFEDLNSYCECQIPINTFNTINLKLFPTYPNPQTVHDYHVPVCTVDIKKMMNSNWDITVQKVANLIDGINHVKRISELANVKPQWTRQSLEHMMYYGCVLLTDIFQYSNIYAVKPEITRLFDHKSGLVQECAKYIVLPNVPEISIERVYALYCGFKYGLTVKDWMEEQQVASLHVDERRIISFGVIKGLIYRVHKYPILTTTNESEVAMLSLPSSASDEVIINKNTGMPIYPDIIPFLDGKHHYDEICTALECSPQELDEQLLAIPNTKFQWKNTYPVDGSTLEPKPEWLALVKDDPILKVTPNTLTPDGIIQNADPSGNNTYCNWSWGGCVKPTDIVTCVDPKVWGTSFDDGPYEVTKDLLAYLKTINVKVTFFVVGKQVINNPEILRQAYDEGHEIGIHTWDHKELTTVSNEMVISELKWTELAIQDVLGVVPRLMRPPRGDIDDRVRYIAQQLGYVPAMWSVDSQDWRITAGGQTEAMLLANVTQWAKEAPTLKQGGNSLMHDLNSVTVGAAIKALPILHPHVQLSPVGTCAGWKNGSYQTATNASTSASVSSGAASPSSSVHVTPAGAVARDPTGTTLTSGSPAVGFNPMILTFVFNVFYFYYYYYLQ
ncbi:hypothetical protein G6F35_004447 [Rhizopus arrhizus]|nr:hypothetical protein G6F35_004447 [Rhizopus arrhizus]